MENKFKNHKTEIFLQWLTLFFLLAVLAYSLWGITTDVFDLKFQGLHAVHRRANFFGPANSFNQMAPEQIQGWMVFRYINLIFHLPPAYLQKQLKITDKRYPNISVDSLAKEQNKTSAQEILAVQKALQDYVIAELKTKSAP
jgi:hypothetical protein